MRLFAVFATIVACLALSRPAPALAQTTEELVARGSVNIGVIATLPPFGFLDDHQQLAGYDIDVAQLVGKYLGIKANLIQLEPTARIPALLSGKVDMVIASFGITPERAKAVWFSTPYSGLENIVAASRSLTIKGFADLKGLHVGFPRGTVQDLILTPALGDGAQISRFTDDASTFQAIASNQVNVIAGTRVTIEGLAKDRPELQLERKFTLLRQPNGITIRKGQTELLRWLNTLVLFAKVNGELNRISEKWLGEPLPDLPVL